MPPELRLPPRRDPDYLRCYEAARRRHDPVFAARLRDRKRRYHRRLARESAEGRAWRRVWVRRSLAALQAAGWTWRRVAAELGVHDRTPSRWWTGERLPHEVTAKRLAALAREVTQR